MNDDDLHDLIRKNRARPQFPASFQREVWARISVTEHLSWSNRYRRWSEAFFGLISQPTIAVATALTMLLLGAGVPNDI